MTKASVISVLTFLMGAVTYALSNNPKYAFDAALIGYALGDAITFLQGSTLTDKWQYASVTVLLIAVLSTAGIFMGQLVSSNAISSYVGGLVGYAIAEAITLLEGNPAPAPPSAPAAAAQPATA